MFYIWVFTLISLRTLKYYDNTNCYIIVLVEETNKRMQIVQRVSRKVDVLISHISFKKFFHLHFWNIFVLFNIVVFCNVVHTSNIYACVFCIGVYYSYLSHEVQTQYVQFRLQTKCVFQVEFLADIGDLLDWLHLLSA